MTNFFAKRRFNFIDGFCISVGSIAISNDKFLIAGIVFVVGVFVSSACEFLNERKTRMES